MGGGWARDESDRQVVAPARLRLWPTVALLTVSLLVWTGFQTFQLVRERGALQRLRAGQEAPMQQGAKVRAQLDSIAKRTLELAQQGNAGAATIVEELAKRGVTINPSTSTAPTR
jgi:hypothetical protein